MMRLATQRGFPFGRRANRALALASIVGICVFLVLALPAAAQSTAGGSEVVASTAVADTTSTTPDGTQDQAGGPIEEETAKANPTQAPANGGTIVTERPVPSAAHILWFAIVALVFALMALIAVLRYTYCIQNRFYAVSENLSKTGTAVKAVPAPSPLPTANRREEAFVEGEGEQRPPPLSIEGPGIVTVGIQSAEFKATIEGKAAETAVWTVEPANAAIVIPATGAAVKVVAATAGAFTVSATVAGPPVASDKKKVAAIAPQNAPVELPFVGGGYGSIVIAITLLATVIVLGLASVLSGEAVATLLGGLLGYIFGVGISATNKKTENQAG